jgi:LPS-assembly protein
MSCTHGSPFATHPLYCMLGYATVSIGCMFRVNCHPHARLLSALRSFLLLTALLLSLSCPGARITPAQQIRMPSGRGGTAELSSNGPQRRQGDLYIADGEVDIHYGDARLRADHVEYNGKTFEATASGHVQFDYNNQHLDGDDAHYNVSTGHGLFRNVRGNIKIDRSPNPTVLISANPLHFEAREVERFPGDVYLIHRAWITICDPEHPKWQFYAPHARIHVDRTIALVNANFRLFRVPLVWLPYASAPAGPKARQSGFLIPDIGQSSRKGFILGEAFYWAPTPWLDTTLGAQYLSRRGVAERGEFRARPFEKTSINYTYFGVDDRGLLSPAGSRAPQGGEQQRLEIHSLLPGGWRFVTDYNQLSSLTFRLAFADTFGEAVNSEVRSAVFLSNNFRGFSLNLAGLNDMSFLTITPATSVTLRNLPEVRFGSVEQAPWRRLPVYIGLDSFVGAVHRGDATFNTPLAVSRTEFAPRVTVPVHFGPWLGITASAAFRSTRYGDSLNSADQISGVSVTRNTGEFTVDLRPPTLERFFEHSTLKDSKSRRRYKHTIEPFITYRYITGVNNFADFIRFDSDATLTDTNEVAYGITQRFFAKSGEDQPQELVSWSFVQKHFFDPTFGGALVPCDRSISSPLPGSCVRNVFQALDSITPFAFALGPVQWSPIVSDFKVTPGGRYDAEQILEYDPTLEKITTIGTLLKVKPYSEYFVTLAHFRLQADPILQPLSHQVRALFGYGSLNRKGFNAAAGVSYDITNSALQNQLVQVSYNGGCCGLALEYRRIALGQVRTENQFRVAFIIANIGTFGNLRHQEKIF